VAGTGTHAATGLLEPEVLSLPPVIAVFDDEALNRALYLWLAALAAVTEHTGDWIGDNLRAGAVALDMFPGLLERHAQLLQGQLALSPDTARLKGAAASAEACVQRALRRRGPAVADGHTPGGCGTGVAVARCRHPADCTGIAAAG
jgi:nitric oxide reductase NorD protein